jgi:hypothetical protein
MFPSFWEKRKHWFRQGHLKAFMSITGSIQSLKCNVLFRIMDTGQSPEILHDMLCIGGKAVPKVCLYMMAQYEILSCQKLNPSLFWDVNLCAAYDCVTPQIDIKKTATVQDWNHFPFFRNFPVSFPHCILHASELLLTDFVTIYTHQRNILWHICPRQELWSQRDSCW